jgi:hypothetical protein
VANWLFLYSESDQADSYPWAAGICGSFFLPIVGNGLHIDTAVYIFLEDLNSVSNTTAETLNFAKDNLRTEHTVLITNSMEQNPS